MYHMRSWAAIHIMYVSHKSSTCLLQAVGTAVDVFVAALDTHKWVTLGSLSARARRGSGALAEAGGHESRVSSLHLQ